MLQFSADAYTVEEPVSVINIYVNRTDGLDGVVSCKFSTANGTAIAGTDYTAQSGTLVWANQDDAPKVFSIPILSRLASGNFTFTINLSNPTGGATFANGVTSVVVTIIRHGFGEADFSGNPWAIQRIHAGGPANLPITVQRNFAFKGTVTVNFHTVDGTALAGTDYTATSGTLTWVDSDGLPKTINIPILAQPAGADKVFTVVIDTPTGGIVIGPTNVANVTITDAVPPANPSTTSAIPNQLIIDQMLQDDDSLVEEFSETNDNIQVGDYRGQNRLANPAAGNFNYRGIGAGVQAGVVVGEHGLIVWCQMSNLTFSVWSPGSSGITTILNGVAINSNGSTTIAVGDGGVILKSTDAGVTWVAKTSGTTNALYGVWALSLTTFIAVGAGGVILVSTDSGNTWGTQTSGTVQDLHSVWFNDASNGWVAGNNGTILHTSNGGTAWAAQTSGTTEQLLGIWGVNLNSLWACGTNGKILTTANGGTNWTAQTSGVAVTLRSVSFATANIGWVVGDSGTALHTTNGGTAWTSVAVGATGPFYGVTKTDAGGNLFVAVGPALKIYLFNLSATGTPQIISAGNTQGSVIGTPSGTSNFNGGSDNFNTDAQSAPTSRFYMKGFSG